PLSWTLDFATPSHLECGRPRRLTDNIPHMATFNDRVPVSNTKRIAVLTGGGDCPGLNAVIRAVVKDAINHGIEVYGIEDGFLGLVEDRIRPLDLDDVSNILTLGGTILGSNNKTNPQKYPVGKNEDGSI